MFQREMEWLKAMLQEPWSSDDDSSDENCADEDSADEDT
jgi:hypothetical protein